MPPVVHAVRGKWDAASSGGCPKNDTWTNNPQFLLLPPAEGGAFSITLRCAAAPKLDIGFVVLRQETKDRAGRKTSSKVRKSELVHKTKWRATDQASAQVELPPPASGKGYIVLPCTFEPGPQASFELQVVNAAGDEFSLMLIGDEPPVPSAAAAAPTPLGATTTAAANAAPSAPSSAPVSAAPPVGSSGAAAAGYAPVTMAPTDTSAGPLAEGEVEVKSEGQGLSAKQKRDTADLIQRALVAAGEGGGLFTDNDFPASAQSLWINGVSPGEAMQAAGVAADLVQSWKRPSDFGAPYIDKEGPPRLFSTDWGVQGVVASDLLNHWLLAACNIVGGDIDVLERIFVDSEHADKGFCACFAPIEPTPVPPPPAPPPVAPVRVSGHGRGRPHARSPPPRRRLSPRPRALCISLSVRADAVRFYFDDPNSEDDWKVVLVDDLLPCGANGLPCFGRCPSPVVLWVSIIEKAFAKLQGSYEATAGNSVEDGLLYLTGGLSREVGITPSNDAQMVDALWGQMMEWWLSAHMVGCEHRTDAEPSAEFQATGLLPNTPYCVVTGGEPMGAGRLVRLRTFHGYSEWTGKWSDNDASWTSRLRQQLSFSKDTNDGARAPHISPYLPIPPIPPHAHAASRTEHRRAKWCDGACASLIALDASPTLTPSSPLHLLP